MEAAFHGNHLPVFRGRLVRGREPPTDFLHELSFLISQVLEQGFVVLSVFFHTQSFFSA